jgi:hypothetical protein
MKSPIWLILCLASLAAFPLGIGPAAPAVVLGQSGTPQLIRQTNVPGIGDTKFPEVLGLGNTAFLATSSGSTSDRRATLVSISQPFETSDFSGVSDLGDSDGQSDYAHSVIAAGTDGTMYLAWIRGTENAIFLRRKGPGETTWGPQQTVVPGGSTDRVRADIAVASDGKIMVAWDENQRYRFRISSDAGANWTSTQTVSDDSSSGRPSLAADGTGGIWIAYGTSGCVGCAGHIKAGYWRNSDFAIRDLTPDKASNEYFADPTVTVTPDNIPHVAWRRIEGGIFFAERDPNSGEWNRSRLVSGTATAFGAVSLASDRSGNIHIAWAGDTSGKYETWYAYKPLNQSWQGPIQASNDNDLDADISVGATLSDYAYGHVVGERFTSAGLRTRYSAFRSQAIECGGTLLLRDSSGNTDITDENPIPGVITPGGCNPALMQVALGSPPTAKNTPAQIAYSPNLAVAVPGSLAGSQCSQRVYVHLYKDANTPFNTAAIFSDEIILDPPGDVDALVSATNPNVGGLSGVFPAAGDPGTAAGASGGDLAWTRTPNYYLSIGPNGDCSGLKSFAAGGTSGNLVNQSYASLLPLPETATAGEKQFDVSVTDTIGNIKAFRQTIGYDPLDDPAVAGADQTGRPSVISATITNDNGDPNARRSIIRTLSFSTVNVTDTRYRLATPGVQFWGVWVANAPRGVANPDPTTLRWVPVPVEAPGTTFSIKWNLFNNGPGPRTDQDGQYTVLVRFLDGAGNPSTTILSTTVTLDPGYRLPGTQLPTVVK